MPAIVLGLAIGIYEALVLHRDVRVPTHRLGHTLHALILAVIAVFCTMNAPYVLSLLNLPAAWYTSTIALQIAIGLFMAIKIHATSRAIKGSVGATTVGLGETWVHSIIVGGLTIAAPYIWPFLAPVMPVWLGGGTGK
jgi:hypothetical protein